MADFFMPEETKIEYLWYNNNRTYEAFYLLQDLYKLEAILNEEIVK